MTKILIAFFIIAFSFQCFSHDSHETQKTTSKISPKVSSNKFGEAISANEKTTLEAVINNFSQFKDKRIVFEAQTEKVCEQKGCWMVVSDGKHQVRTLFKDYGFFVPKDIVGKKVRVQGIMEQKKISAATLRHYKKDEGAKLEEIKKIKTGKIDYQFTADAVEII